MKAKIFRRSHRIFPDYIIKYRILVIILFNKKFVIIRVHHNSIPYNIKKVIKIDKSIYSNTITYNKKNIYLYTYNIYNDIWFKQKLNRK